MCVFEVLLTLFSIIYSCWEWMAESQSYSGCEISEMDGATIRCSWSRFKRHAKDTTEIDNARYLWKPQLWSNPDNDAVPIVEYVGRFEHEFIVMPHLRPCLTYLSLGPTLRKLWISLKVRCDIDIFSLFEIIRGRFSWMNNMSQICMIYHY